MACRLIWSPQAIEDIDAIAAYIERDSVWYARIVVRKIVETAQKIQDFPGIGRIVPEVGSPAIRERFVYSYRVIYRMASDQVLIAAVIHGSRLLEPVVQRMAEE